MNACGFCVTYTELRRYLTSDANHEIDGISGDRYIPGGILPISEGGHLIQEGSDNIDLNTETLDGKNTFHSLARAVFQIKSTGDYDYCSERINRGTDRSLSIDDTTSSLTDAIPYSKPKCRAEPSRRSYAFDNLEDSDKNVAISCSSRFVARFYDQKKYFASSHHNINKLRVKLATSRDASLVRLPPSEAYSTCLIPDQSLACFLSGKTTSGFTNGIRMANCQGFFASSLL